MEKKKCKRCGKKKELDAFYDAEITKDGKQVYCKKCMYQYQKERRENNKEKLLEKERKYRQENKDNIRAYHKEYYSRPEVKIKTAEYHKKYKKKNKDKLKQYHAEYNKNKKEIINKRALDYYYANREKILAKRKAKRGGK